MIVNDGSKDNTYQKMLLLQEKYPLLIPVDKSNSGHGATCLFAYRKAIEANADYIFQTDSDGQTDPEDTDCTISRRMTSVSCLERLVSRSDIIQTFGRHRKLGQSLRQSGRN
jgi:glycosyltransferase involved in cell wall biosynthesis